MKPSTLPIVALLSTVLLFTALLAGCGSSDDESVDAIQDQLPGAGGDDGDQLPLGGGPYPVGTIDITVSHPDHDDVVYTISCLGDTATITPAVDGLTDSAACTQLAESAVQDLLVLGPSPDRVCTEIYGGPDEAAIVGSLDDQPIDTIITRNNGCGIGDWDDVLSAVLPTAKGVTP